MLCVYKVQPFLPLYVFLVRVSNANQIFHGRWNVSTECSAMVLETASDWVMVFRDDIDQ